MLVRTAPAEFEKDSKDYFMEVITYDFKLYLNPSKSWIHKIDKN